MTRSAAAASAAPGPARPGPLGSEPAGSSAAGPWDAGLQNERTALAWQRTLLAGLACALVVVRLLALVSWPAAAASGVAAVGCATGVTVLARNRFRGNAVALWQHRPLGDGRAPLLVTVLVVVTATAAALLVVLIRPQP